MQARNMSLPLRAGLGLLALALLLVWSLGPPAPATAEPPPWAPAHGYRAKHKPHFDQPARYAIVPVPYGIEHGRCDRERIASALLGTVVGGAVGGVAGSQFGKGDGKTAATIVGSIAGAVLGNSIGRMMDQIDRHCLAQALEFAPDDRTVEWYADQGPAYAVTPERTYLAADGAYCREYQAAATVGDERQSVYGTACREPDGSWRLMN